jgi:DNA phosphorothioation-dependent restriction protein DptH
MSLPAGLTNGVAKSIASELSAAAVGHCLRVDHLSREVAVSICEQVELLAEGGAEAYVLTRGSENGRSISFERAIELRNRKRTRLCLFVPSGIADAAASSLWNSFKAFDLDRAFHKVARELLDDLPDETRAFVAEVHGVLRGRAVVSTQRWAEYVATVAETPSLQTAALSLWFVNLIPDAGEDPGSRVRDNLRCASALLRPGRPQASPEERMALTGIAEADIEAGMVSLLRAEGMARSSSWLSAISRDHVESLTFDRWRFLDMPDSDLEAIDVAPFLDSQGIVHKNTGLFQEAPGTQPMAHTGNKAKIVVKWSPRPTTPGQVRRWRAEIVPSREHLSGEAADVVELPSSEASARVHRCTIKLEDVDLDVIPMRAVQVRVVALGEHGSELTFAGDVVEGFSEEFWLTEEGVRAPLESSKRETVPTLQLGRVSTAVASGASTLDEAPGRWTEEDLHFFSVLLNGRNTLRIGLSPALRALEEDRIFRATDAGRYSVRVDAAEQVSSERFEHLPSSSLDDSEVGAKLAARRREVFGLLEQQKHRSLVEVVDWTQDLTKRTRSYANAYREALRSATEPTIAEELTNMDTVLLEIEHGHGAERSLLVLPTHPLRLVWFAAYVELLRDWESRVRDLDARIRRKVLDLALLRRVAPLNVPFMIRNEGVDYAFAQNLRFFWGVALPVHASDPARRLADVAWAAGLTEDEAQLADLPPERVARELSSYLQVHPYADALRLFVLNPGAGSFIAAMLRSFLQQRAGSPVEDEEARVIPAIEVVTQARPPLPAKLGPLAELQRSLYEAPPRPGVSHLAPQFSVWLRQAMSDGDLPDGHANVAFSLDQLRPGAQISTEDPGGGDSSSLYGLLLRLWSRFDVTEEGARWVHTLHLPQDAPRERHPSIPALTNELIDGIRSFQHAVAVASGLASDGTPSIVATLTPEERSALDRLHDVSDWVITLDRYLGVEYFDDPSAPDLARVSKTYLLDYAPEFLEGIGHRMLVTTTQRDEVEAILTRAMVDLGFEMVEESVGEVLAHLKTISGRLALRVVGDESRAREAVSLGVVAAYLRSQGELDDAILIPVDSHPELFGVAARAEHLGTPRARCDLVRVRFMRSRLVATFIETKSRTAAARSDELMNRIVDQIHATEDVFKDLFFRSEPPRLDHVLQRSRLATILGFYLRRALRHGLISSEDRFREMEASIARLESGIPDLRIERLGFVVNLSAAPDRPIRFIDTEIRLLTARDLLSAGLSVGTTSLEPTDELLPEGGRELEPQGGLQRADVDKRPEGRPPTSVPIPSDTASLERANREVDEGPTEQTETQPERPDHVDLMEEVEGPGDADPKYALPSSESTIAVEPLDDQASSDERPADTDLSVELGTVELDGGPVSWRPSLRGSPHLFILGIPGMGKSVTVTRILRSLAEQALPALIVDFHGQFRDNANPYTAFANPLVLDASRGLPFSPFEASASRDAGASYWQTNAFAVGEIFQYVCGLGDIQRDVVYQAIADGYRAHGWEAGSPDGTPTIGEVRERLLELETQRGVRNVMPRLRPLLEFGLFDEGQPTLGFHEMLSRGLVLDVSRVGLEAAQLAAAAFVLRKLYKDMFQWGESDQLRLAVSLDEAHRLANDITLPKLMKEGRKFGLSVLVASQGLRDFHPDVLSNSGARVVFRTNFPMSKTVAGFFRADRRFDLAAAIEQLDVGEAYVQTPEMNRCARVRMHSLT